MIILSLILAVVIGVCIVDVAREYLIPSLHQQIKENMIKKDKREQAKEDKS